MLSSQEKLELVALQEEAHKRGLPLPQSDTSGPFKEFQETYRLQPRQFVEDCIAFRSGEEPAHYQLEIVERLVPERRVAVRAPHGAGKSALASWIVLWAILTADDCKVPTTASVWRQLDKMLWPEIHKWAVRLKWDVIGRSPFDQRYELQTLQLRRSPLCFAFAIASDKAEYIEGVHAERVVYIYDEAKSIPPATWDASEGAFSGAGTDTGREAYALAISTPGPPAGRFYAIHQQAPGYGNWWTRHVKIEECVNAGRVSKQWAKEKREQWGEDSTVYKNRVLGEFGSTADDSVIPLEWVEQAQERWLEWAKDKKPTLEGHRVLGVDVARFGTDKSCVADRTGPCVRKLHKWGKKDTMETVGLISNIWKEGYEVQVDVIGIGAGVTDRLRETGIDAIAVNFGKGTSRTDISGEVEMLNVRAAAWWGLREDLEPPSDVMLPPDNDGEVVGDLTAPKYTYTSAGKLKLETKEDIRSRIGRSPDVGDAIVLSFWTPETTEPKGSAGRAKRQPKEPPTTRAPEEMAVLCYRGRKSFPMDAGPYHWMIEPDWKRQVEAKLAHRVAAKFPDHFYIEEPTE